MSQQVKVYRKLELRENAYIDTTGATLPFYVAGTAEANLTASAFAPATSDGNALGTASKMWSDLFLASGSVINLNNGDITLTHSAGVLTVGGDGGVVLTLGANVDISFTGTTGTNEIVLTNALADALSITDGSADILVIDTSTAGNVWTLSASLLATNASLTATGRAGKFSGTYAAAALTDGYGAFEVDVTLSGSPTDHTAASSSWINITGGTVPAGTYICARNDGVYEEAAATVTNAKIIFGSRMQYIFSDTDALRFPFSVNTGNAAITALIDVNNLTDLGTVSNAGATAATLLPICRDAGGTLKYVLLYDLQ